MKAVLSGFANPALTGADLDAPVSYEGLRDAGGGLGSAGFIVYDDRTNMVEVARLASNYLYVESCGQCSPCKLGSGDITERLDRIARSGGDDDDVEAIGARLLTVTDANRCYLGTQEQELISSILRLFPEDVVAALDGGGIEGRGLDVPKLVELDQYDPRPAPQAARLDLHAMSREMTDEERRDFLLAGTRTGKVAWVSPKGNVHVAPDLVRARRRRRRSSPPTRTAPRARRFTDGTRLSMVVDDQAPPFSYVKVDGTGRA